MPNEISVCNLSFRYQDSTPYVLKDISLTVKKGEWLTILGPNGSGKSTLAKFFNALLIPLTGEVVSCGKNTVDSAEWSSIRRDVSMVFQNPDNQLVAPTVEDDVAFGLESAGIPYDEMHQRVKDCIQRLGLEGFEKTEPHNLSGGQKQRVALAGALALKPKVIVLDEATSMLDPQGRNEVLTIVRKLNKEDGVTIIAITHDVNEAIASDRVIVLNDGSIVYEGIPRELLANREILRANNLSSPFIVDVARELRKYQILIDENVLTHEELVNAICSYKRII
ncbi:energy-coupling factor transporter ATPase [Salipaludibacillus neizhouensis]|uniref:Energy-coupling factor transporter ATPase n=1 Tax=Salipaludibacillus neizhouensis TaxID=885475 RepID=A0A3A9JWS6_9BACI|nr:energy-coupling factor transporter ATPase [Salipaludibacillus neizhouensis]RKL65354.1 energy-coupling factor transporter ATPase [Salipaludibacillus neizhouensis]